MIDTHQHFWRLARGGYDWMPEDLPVLRRDHEPAHLHPLLEQNGITGTIAVQADDNVAETRFLLDLAADTPWILGVVGWVDLEDPACRGELSRLAAAPHLVGIRPMMQDLADDRWMLRPALGDNLAALIEHDLTFDALVRPRHLPVLATFLDRYPALRVVVDHCAKPDIAGGDLGIWKRDMEAVAARPNSFCKLSGLLTEAGPEVGQGAGHEAVKPVLDHALHCFGPDRLLFGSDWPVLNLAADYGSWFRIMRDWAQESGGRADLKTMLTSIPYRAYPRLSAS